MFLVDWCVVMTLGCFAALAKLQEDFGFGYFVVGYCEGIR